MSDTTIDLIEQATVPVFKTKHHSLFGNHPDNRRFKQAHVDRLKIDIDRNNMLSLNPIVVTPYNAEYAKLSVAAKEYKIPEETPEYWVANGMHRMRAAQELGLEIYFVVQDDLKQEDIEALNTNMDWSAKDWLDHHLDKAGYKIIKEFMDAHPEFTLPVVQNLLLMATKTNKAEFEAGRFMVTAENKKAATMLAKQLKEIADLLPEAQAKLVYKSGFVRAMILCVKDGGYAMDKTLTTHKTDNQGDHITASICFNRFRERLAKKLKDFVSCNGEAANLAMIESIYNHDLRANDAVGVMFLVDKKAKGFIAAHAKAQAKAKAQAEEIKELKRKIKEGK